MRFYLSSKIHKATVTDARVDYEGSIGIDKALIEAAGLKAGEKVLVVDNTSGARLETYVIEKEANSGDIVIYGGAARLVKKGDEIIIMGFELADAPVKPKKILVDKDNKIEKDL